MRRGRTGRRRSDGSRRAGRGLPIRSGRSRSGPRDRQPRCRRRPRPGRLTLPGCRPRSSARSRARRGRSRAARSPASHPERRARRAAVRRSPRRSRSGRDRVAVTERGTREAQGGRAGHLDHLAPCGRRGLPRRICTAGRERGEHDQDGVCRRRQPSRRCAHCRPDSPDTPRAVRTGSRRSPPRSFRRDPQRRLGLRWAD